MLKPSRRPNLERGATSPSATSPVDEVKALELARLSAMMKADVDAVAACLDDDLIYVHSSGMIDTKESYLAALTAGQFVYESIDVLETRHAQGVDFVVLCHVLSARIRLKSQSESMQRQMVASSTWRFFGGNWRLISMQATPRAAASS